MTINFSYKSFVHGVNKDLIKAEKRQIKKAAKHLVSKMKKKVNRRGHSQPGQPPSKKNASLKKGIGYKMIGNELALVGYGPPAQHAHLMELGTKKRQTSKGKNTGKVSKRPVLIPTFEEEAGPVENILSERWV